MSRCAILLFNPLLIRVKIRAHFRYSYSFVSGLEPDRKCSGFSSKLVSSAGIADLTRRLAARDEEAFREFHTRYFDRLYQFLLVVAHGQEQEAQDALQETLLRCRPPCPGI